jgi:hypothetical protein
MARRATQPRVRRSPVFRFDFIGFRDGWYLLRADMSAYNRNLESLSFEARVTTFLVTQRLTPGIWSHFGSGNTGEYPIVPDEDGSALCLLLKRPADVLRIAAEFPCRGVSDETLMAALRAEASVHIFVVEDVAKVVHDALRRLSLTFGDPYPTWEQLDGETRVEFLLTVEHSMTHPEETPQARHERWVDQRMKDGWRYGTTFSAVALRDPLILPWKNLSERAQARYRLIVAVAQSLMPLAR